MIRISTAELSAETDRSLAIYQGLVDIGADYPKRVLLADQKFSSYNRPTNAAFSEVRSVLSDSCCGARRCMYCEDSVSDEVEHHRPKNLYPEDTFGWHNFLYACGSCNGPKNNKFAVIVDGELVSVTRKKDDQIVPPMEGTPALLHPRKENPLDFLFLDIAGRTFRFVPHPLSDKGAQLRAIYTIDLLRLNSRDFLPKARGVAFDSYVAILEKYVRDRLDDEVGARCRKALSELHHRTVWLEIIRQRKLLQGIDDLFEEAPEALTF